MMTEKPSYKGHTVYISYYKSHGTDIYYGMYGKPGERLKNGDIRNTSASALRNTHAKIDETEESC